MAHPQPLNIETSSSPPLATPAKREGEQEKTYVFTPLPLTPSSPAAALLMSTSSSSSPPVIVPATGEHDTHFLPLTQNPHMDKHSIEMAKEATQEADPSKKMKNNVSFSLGVPEDQDQDQDQEEMHPPTTPANELVGAEEVDDDEEEAPLSLHIWWSWPLDTLGVEDRGRVLPW
ncbi:MAG: hypothetical protein L6R39_004589 [Caloplaca ligustica]|nr:MAG: hypothetical protein L6R39_004589 [Caloplaca ligustica]